LAEALAASAFEAASPKGSFTVAKGRVSDLTDDVYELVEHDKSDFMGR
jgi:hypothetical protein